MMQCQAISVIMFVHRIMDFLCTNMDIRYRGDGMDSRICLQLGYQV